MDDQLGLDKLAEHAITIREMREATRLVEETNRKEKTLLRFWKIMFEIIAATILFIVLKIITFVSYWKAHYRGFIAFVDKYSNMKNPTTGEMYYTGPGGLITALALESPILRLTFVNKFFPEALFYLYSTKDLNKYLSELGGEASLADPLSDPRMP